MSTTSLIRPPAPSRVDHTPAFGEMLAELLPLIGVVAVAGPPVLLLAGPLVLGVLMLAGPFAVLATLVLLVALIASAVLVVLTGAIAATRYSLVQLRVHREGHAHSSAPTGQLVAIHPRHGAA
jgi:hypothetical protein